MLERVRWRQIEVPLDDRQFAEEIDRSGFARGAAFTGHGENLVSDGFEGAHLYVRRTTPSFFSSLAGFSPRGIYRPNFRRRFRCAPASRLSAIIPVKATG
jgi:hypothetical protein